MGAWSVDLMFSVEQETNSWIINEMQVADKPSETTMEVTSLNDSIQGKPNELI